MKLIIRITKFLFVIISKIYTYHLHLYLQAIKNRIYSLWIQNFLGNIGEGSFIAYPCRLQGGGEKRIFVGQGTHFQSHCVLGCWVNHGKVVYNPTIIVGDNCMIGEYNQITAINKVTIGNGVLTGRYVYIGDNSHGGLSQDEANIPPAKRKLQSKGTVNIGNNVWIGDKATILGGVTIGDNVIIGSNSVVTRDIPSNCIAVGAPAKIVKTV
ncbi:MAG: acyltransferase [Bacteroidales bacterium]|nr:acyltransferase [Bacteroidales bacterium]